MANVLREDETILVTERDTPDFLHFAIAITTSWGSSIHWRLKVGRSEMSGAKNQPEEGSGKWGK